jgi:hypothetical protein
VAARFFYWKILKGKTMAGPTSSKQKATFAVYYGKDIAPTSVLRLTEETDAPIIPFEIAYPGFNSKPVDCQEVQLIRRHFDNTLAGLKRKIRINPQPLRSKEPSQSVSYSTRKLAYSCFEKGQYNRMLCDQYSLAELKREEKKTNMAPLSNARSGEFSENYRRTLAHIHILETLLGIPLTPKPKRIGDVWHIGAIYLFRVRQSDIPLLYLRHPDSCAVNPDQEISFDPSH